MYLSTLSQLSIYGLNPRDWSVFQSAKQFLIIENKFESSMKMMALIKGSKIYELQLISI